MRFTSAQASACVGSRPSLSARACQIVGGLGLVVMGLAFPGGGDVKEPSGIAFRALLKIGAGFLFGIEGCASHTCAAGAGDNRP